MRPIGYYVHHHGIGHWKRAVALAGRLRRPCVLLGTVTAAQRAAAPCPVLALPDDAPTGGCHGDPDGVPGLHYAPLGLDGLRRRTAALAGWIAEARPALMVIDVSVEAAILSRLCATPYLYVRLAGHRADAPHLAAFRGAEALVAPYPAVLEAPGTADWVLARTFHAGFLAPPPALPSAGGGIVVVFGRGGAGGEREALAAAARAAPDRRWRVLGPVSSGTAELPANLVLLGWREDAASMLAEADLVIGGAGNGLVSQVVALGKRFLCLPEPRPFDEQRATAARLAALDAAVVREAWPSAAEWPALLCDVEALDAARIASLHDAEGLARTAGFIDGVADRSERYGG